MKELRLVISIAIVVALTFLVSCKDGDGETVKETRTAMLLEKENGWTATAVIVPVASATQSTDWEGNFKVSFSTSNMSTSGHPSGATAVWPGGSWVFKNQEATIITRSDGVEMNVLNISETTLQVQFVVPEDVQLSGRIAALGGSYTFTMN